MLLRREQAFTPDSGFWSGNLPTLTLDPGSASAAGVATGAGSSEYARI